MKSEFFIYKSILLIKQQRKKIIKNGKRDHLFCKQFLNKMAV